MVIKVDDTQFCNWSFGAEVCNLDALYTAASTWIKLKPQTAISGSKIWIGGGSNNLRLCGVKVLGTQIEVLPSQFA